jgi:FdrA protein
MTVIGQVRKGAYFDSVTLMRIGRELSAMPGIIDAAVVMGTKANKGILAGSGLMIHDFDKTGDTDLLIALKAKDRKAADAAMTALTAELNKSVASTAPTSEKIAPHSLDSALKVIPDANMALISVAGRYAGMEARKALNNGLHVMLFSDNVPLETEVELKEIAREKGLLVMGPDCGTAIINGVPLAFANVVQRGPIGIVAAAGTGLQEVSTIISNEGSGISQAIGTGGRDVKKEVGGIMFMEGIKALAADKATRVILLVSKPPHPDVLKRIKTVLAQVKKPVVSLFLGAGEPGKDPQTLEEAALMVVEWARKGDPKKVAQRMVDRDAAYNRWIIPAAQKLRKGQKYIRGLFSGGTFCSEAQILLSGVLNELYSNAPTAGAKALKNSLKSQKNTILDLGEDEFTVGRPHPMIDYTLRNRRILEEAADPTTAVILLDVVLGYGSHPNPADELKDVIHKASQKVCVVCSVTGTDADPQNRSRVVDALKAAGALVLPTNAAACRLAGKIVRHGGE